MRNGTPLKDIYGSHRTANAVSKENQANIQIETSFRENESPAVTNTAAKKKSNIHLQQFHWGIKSLGTNSHNYINHLEKNCQLRKN